jgi:hypothetical protein
MRSHRRICARHRHREAFWESPRLGVAAAQQLLPQLPQTDAQALRGRHLAHPRARERDPNVLSDPNPHYVLATRARARLACAAFLAACFAAR